MAALEHHQNNALAPPTISDQGAALADWLAARGGACHPRVDLRRRRDDDVGGERSAVAAAPIAAGELLLRVPARCALRRDDEDAPAAVDGILEERSGRYAALPENPEVLDAWTRGGGPSSRARASRAPAATTRSGAGCRAIRGSCELRARPGDGSWALVPGVDALNDGRGRAAPCTTLEVDGDGVFEMVASRDLGSGEELTHCSGQEFPTSKAPISADFHSAGRRAPRRFVAVVRGAPPDALLSAVAALVASAGDFAAWEAAVDDGLAGGAQRDL
ncbi:DNA mismatch repair protein [Aureococcus anophagefferens]|uniref:DNA mismatch repair protein n=1 Tax=Aureococcus anophagefferens TaxID=44056 RepID=A0ABR1GF83_AURAN